MHQPPRKLTNLLAQFRHRLSETDHSVRSLARASGVPHRTVADLMGARIPLSVLNLEALAKVLGCRLTLTVVEDARDDSDAPA